MTPPSVVSFGPDRPWSRPGAEFEIGAAISAFGPTPAIATVELVDVDRVVNSRRLEIPPAPEPQTLTVALTLPAAPRHGYGVRLTLEWGDSRTEADAAIEAIEGWWESPRMAAITEYADAGAIAERVSQLRDWHVNVMQHYDWMWRHYRYTPPDGAAEFEDTLGRAVSHDAVRAAIDAGHAVAIASLAYGSVYGAEQEHVERHPADRVFDEEGRPLSLGSTFYINDLRPGTAWRRRLLAAYTNAVREFGFDGIHMDTYGDPHTAVSFDGEAIEFAALYPGLIDEAARIVATTRPGAKVTFNCVDGFALEAVAPSAAACLYLELWASDGAFSDVVRWTERARAVADGRQVVIAAYAIAVGTLAHDDDRAGAIEATLLLATVISVAGAYHHTLAEGDRLLVEGYYPTAMEMSPSEAEAMKALSRFTARYVRLLSDPRLTGADLGGLRLLAADGSEVETSPRPVAGSVWMVDRQTHDGTRVIHLVDLRTQAQDRWTEALRVSPPTTGLHLAGLSAGPVAASPWSDDQDAKALASSAEASSIWRLPTFRRWLMIVAPSR